jgi:hypothetical protein
MNATLGGPNYMETIEVYFTRKVLQDKIDKNEIDTSAIFKINSYLNSNASLFNNFEEKNKSKSKKSKSKKSQGKSKKSQGKSKSKSKKSKSKSMKKASK